MSISYAPLDDDEIILPARVQPQAKAKVAVKKQPSSVGGVELPAFREGTECNILVIFFIISLIYIMMSA